MLSLAHHPACSRPALARAVFKRRELARWHLRRLVARCRSLCLAANHPLQSGVLRQADDVVDLLGLTPAQQRIPAEPRVTAQDDLRPRPGRAQTLHDAHQLFLRAGSTVLVRFTQPRAQQLLAAEDVQRQVAVAVVVTMKEPAFLMAVPFWWPCPSGGRAIDRPPHQCPASPMQALIRTTR